MRTLREEKELKFRELLEIALDIEVDKFMDNPKNQTPIQKYKVEKVYYNLMDIINGDSRVQMTPFIDRVVYDRLTNILMNLEGVIGREDKKFYEEYFSDRESLEEIGVPYVTSLLNRTKKSHTEVMLRYACNCLYKEIDENS